MLVDPDKLVLICSGELNGNSLVRDLDIIWVDRETAKERARLAHKIAHTRWGKYTRAYPFRLDETTPDYSAWEHSDVCRYLNFIGMEPD